MKNSFFLFCFAIGWLLPSSIAAETSPAPAKVVRYAEVLIKRYDTNGDGVLQREEWDKMPGAPQAIDLDGDGLITKDKLVWFINHFGQSRTIHRTLIRDLSAPYKFDPEKLQILRPAVRRAAPMILDPEATQEPTEGGVEVMMKANEELVDEDVYQKMLEERQIPSERPYHVLPETLRGVPSWFIVLDKNGDGQISLREFDPSLSPRGVELFKQLDKNKNGVIEPDEVRGTK